MKITAHSILFLLFFGITSSIVHAQAPSDENFDDNTSFDLISNDFTLDGVRYQISGNGSTYRHATFNDTFNLSEGGTSDYALQFDKNANGGINSVTISANNGSTFQITGMSMDILSDTPVQFTSDNGGSFSLSANDGTYVFYQNYDFTAQSGFDNITTLTISGTNMMADIDDLNFEQAVLPATAPTVTTSATSSITATGATLNGDVTSDGGATLTTRGFVYSSSDNTPTLGEGGVTDVPDGSGTGVFNEVISGLSASTTYYYQAYATNTEGTTYGGVVNFTTSAPNAAPIVDANTGLTVTEGETGNIDSGKLHFNDDETVDDAQLTATITSAVAHGTLFLDANLNNTFDSGEEELLVNATFTQDDINNNRLRYTNTVGNQTSDSFGFTLSDPDGGELTNQTFTITINLLEVPTVTTTTASGISHTAATLGGNVTDNGGASVTERGIVYNTTSTPTTADTKVQIGSGDGSFTQEITGLTEGTTYYVRAYAINSEGTSYGSEVSFTTTSNDTPSGSVITNQSECINGSVSGLALTITDTFPGDNNFMVTAASSNTSVVANANIKITGSDNTRSLAITPVLDAAGTSTITISIKDSLGEIGTQTFDVTFNDLIPPTLTAVSDREENLDANCNFTVPDYTGLTTATDNCGTTTVTQSPIAGTVISGHGTLQTITLTADDGNGNTDSTTFDVTLVDVTAPTLTAVSDREEDLDANCNFTVPDYTGLTTATDNCGTVTVTQSPIAGTVISGHGTVQTITLTADDGNGNTDSTTFDVTLLDATVPTLTAVSDRGEDLDASCNFTVPDYTGLTIATDNCGTATVTQSPIAGTVISGHGTLQTITLTADDGNGNTDSTTFDVTLVDATAPTLTAVSDREDDLDASCNFTVPDYTGLTTATDNCETATVIQSPIAGTVISGHGTVQTITLTADDGNGNTNSTTFDVTLVDVTAPTLTAITSIEEDLDASCDFTIPDYTGLTTATDNCGTVAVTQSPIAGTVIRGHGTLQTITLTADDGNGNTNSTTFNVTLKDVTEPTITVQDVAIQLNDTGSVSITAEAFVVDSYDSCGIASISIDRTDFDCADLGDYTIMIAATDINGNVKMETAILTLTGEDTDGDSIADSCDTDNDNDGTPDNEDAFPLDETEDTDTDGDGIGNNSDTDDDNDGTPDNEDAFPLDETEDTDTDGDGIGNNSDADDDNDGTPDNEDAFSLDETEDTDTDGDGIGNNSDTDDDNDGTPDNEDAFPLD
ncbi:cadherin-like domain-containing protein, partial [Flagellimonas halotolerans]